MSGLSRWLVWDKQRPDLDGGEKTPAFVDVPVDPQMHEVVVSTPKGEYRVRDRSGADTNHQRAGSFELEPAVEAEDKAQAELVEYLYTQSAKRNWGNAVSRDQLDDDLVEECFDYLETFDLDLNNVHVGTDTAQHLQTTSGFNSHSDALTSESSKDDFAGVMEDHYALGKYDGKPVFFNPHLDDLAVFSAESEYVGIGVRIRDRVSVVVHNPIRSLVLVELA